MEFADGAAGYAVGVSEVGWGGTLVRESSRQYGSGRGPVGMGSSKEARSPESIPLIECRDTRDSLESLETEITTLAAEIHAATHRLLVLLAEFHRREGWKVAGHASAPTGCTFGPASI